MFSDRGGDSGAIATANYTARKFGVKSAQVQGTGEPFINKSLPDAIIKGHEAGLSIGTGTNGYFLNEKTPIIFMIGINPS